MTQPKAAGGFATGAAHWSADFDFHLCILIYILLAQDEAHEMKCLNTESRIVESLRGDIRRGALSAGKPLLQDELASRFDVSRVPIRDAIKTLEAEGLVTLLPNRTAVVTVMRAEDIEEIFDLRLLLERDLIRRAVKLATAAQQAAVEELAGLLDMVRTGERFAALDTELHSALYAPAARLRQAAIASKLGHQVARFYGSALDVSTYHRECQEGHRAIASAFVARDANQAVVSLTEHLRLAKSKVMQLLKETE